MTRNENKRKRAQIEAKRSKGAYHIMGISNVIALLSGVALFLFGMTLMGRSEEGRGQQAGASAV